MKHLLHCFFPPSSVPCGGTYNATWTPQNISSSYLSNWSVPLSTCTWVIEAPPHQQVKITVWALQLHSQDCAQNYLEFQDSPEVMVMGWMTVASRDLVTTSICKTLEVMKAWFNKSSKLLLAWCFSARPKVQVNRNTWTWFYRLGTFKHSDS